MSHSRQKKLTNRKRRIAYRLRDRNWAPQEDPMLAARNIHYDLADRTRGLGAGGIEAMHLLARRIPEPTTAGDFCRPSTRSARSLGPVRRT